MAVPELTLIEERIAVLIATGQSTAEIAADLALDERTIEWHLARASRKLESISTLAGQVRRHTRGDAPRQRRKR